MSTRKVAITMERKLLMKLDRLVQTRVFLNRSRAIQTAVEEKIKRLDHSRLAQECSKLDSRYEQALAEEGFSQELTEWPEY